MLEIFINENNIVKAGGLIKNGQTLLGANLLKETFKPLAKNIKSEDPFWQEQVYYVVCGLFLLQLENPKKQVTSAAEILKNIVENLDTLCGLISVDFFDNSVGHVGYPISEQTIRLLSSLLTSTKIRQSIIIMTKVQLERIVLFNHEELK